MQTYIHTYIVSFTITHLRMPISSIPNSELYIEDSMQMSNYFK